MKFQISLLFLFLALSACQNNTTSVQTPSTNFQLDEFEFFSPTLLIQDKNGNAIPNAKVLIGYQINEPFENNFLIADDAGVLDLPNEWNTELPLTVEAQGFLRITHLNAHPKSQIITLIKDPGYNPIEVKGVVNGFGDLPTDKHMDFGMVIKMMKRDGLVSFDLNELISPYNDYITAMGQRVGIPSNLSLPNQKVKYSILTLGFNKPQYRSYTRQQGLLNYYVAQGNFHFKNVVDILRSGGDLFSAIDELNLTSGGFNHQVVGPQGATLNLKVGQVKFNASTQIHAPQYPSDLFVASVTLNKRNDNYFPTDIVSLKPGESKSVRYVAGETPEFVSLLGKSEQSASGPIIQPQMSLTITQINENIEFIPHIPKPVLKENLLKAEVPNYSFYKAGTYAVLEDIRKLSSGDAQVDVITKRWEIFANNWESTIQIPEWPEGTTTRNKSQWAIHYLGTNEETLGFSRDSFSKTTHLTRNVTDSN